MMYRTSILTSEPTYGKSGSEGLHRGELERDQNPNADEVIYRVVQFVEEKNLVIYAISETLSITCSRATLAMQLQNLDIKSGTKFMIKDSVDRRVNGKVETILLNIKIVQ